MKKMILLFTLLSLVFAKDSNEEIAKDIKESLMAPCCWSGTVYDHGHSQMEEEIDAFVAEGRSKDDILQYYVGMYGERILAIPVASGFNLFAWIAPVIILGIGLFILIMFIRSPKKSDPKTISRDDGIPHSDQIEKELAEMD